MTLLNRQRFADLSRRADVADPNGAYPDSYLLGVLQAVENEIGAYLHFAPALQVHAAEQGPISFMSSGAYAGRYEIELQHRPLPPAPAAMIFASLQLTYALAFTTPADVLLTYVTVDHGTGRVYALAPGVVDALAGFGFQYGAGVAGYATGYTATYAAGYACGISDPTPDGTANTTYNAPPLPEDIRLAAVSLVREQLMIDDALSAEPTNPSAGTLASAQLDQWKLQYRQARSADAEITIGYGTPLARNAQAKLARWVRTSVVSLV